MALHNLLLESLALVGGTVHPMTPGSAPAPATVLIEAGRIAAVGAEVEVPEGARVVDVTGLHLVPGLIDGLAYYDPEHDVLYTGAGVTLVRDHGNDLARILQLREPEVRERLAGPALSICGAVVDGYPPSTPSALVLRDEHEVHGFVPTMIDEGIDFLAVQVSLSGAAWRELVALAHPDEGRRLQVWGPRPKDVPLLDLLLNGQDGLLFLDALLPEGTSWEQAEPASFDGVIAKLAGAGLRITPLLRGTARLGDPVGPQDPRLELLSAQYAGLWLQDLEMRARMEEGFAERSRRVLAVQKELLRRLDGAGVQLVPGSGAPHPWLLPGSGLVDELELWQQAGIPAARCLELATAGAARALELEGRGTLEVGAVADVVLLGADPTEDIAALRGVEGVVLRGRLLEAAELAQRAQALREILLAQREAAERPIDVREPTLPAGRVLLSGYAETSGAGGRIAGERWAVVRAGNGDLTFCGRRRVPQAENEVEVHQTLRKGELVAFTVALRTAGHEVAARGQFVAGQMRVERRVDGGFVDTKAAREQLAAVDVSSVTTLMLLAHARDPGPLPVLRFDEALELEVVRWDLALQEDGGHWLRTPQGRKFAAFRPDGALKAAGDWLGSSFLRTESVAIDVHEGPGLPLPEGKLQKVLAAEAAAREAAGQPAEAGAQPPGAGGGDPQGGGGG